MNNTDLYYPHSVHNGNRHRVLPRDRYLAVLKAAIEANEYRFAREAALTWLAAYPGDLQASLYYAQALLGETRPKQALPVLEGLCQGDPEFMEAADALLKAELQVGARRAPDFLAYVLALNGEITEQQTIATWGRSLWMSRQALKNGDYEQAEQLINQALAADPSIPLVAVTHLEILEARRQASLQARRSLGEFYHQRWPTCLQCTLLLADWLMDSGESDQAVALLHQAAAQDVGGQVAERLWGKDHSYLAIWPQRLELPLDISIPGGVTAILGWNQLPPGALEDLPEPEETSVEDTQPIRIEKPPAPEPVEVKTALPPEPVEEPAPSPEIPPASDRPPAPETLQVIQEELERVAGRLNQPGIMRSDGRFPIYIVFSTCTGLESQYGPQASAQIQMEMKRLVEAVKARGDCGAYLFLPDETSTTAPLGIKPARPDDPWELKLALADLDAALSKHGERIGALLIVGGPEVVPFHLLPNPVDDDDSDVPSDNPYATPDENYFIPEWPVGRLPGGTSHDPDLLLAALKRATAHHENGFIQANWYRRWLEWLLSWLRPRLPGGRPSFGYTAAIWRKASLSVFHPIGEPRSMMVSPPVMAGDDHGQNGVLLPTAKLGYFNLHGLPDAVEWYGQRDPLEAAEGPDYPVALRPKDVLNSGRAPQVVFSEACYGANIRDKSAEEAMALKFLSAGSLAVVGSTVMAYGSVSTPLIAADLVGNAFWKKLNEGFPVGEALRRAKIHLAREMHQRQGYLDGEDQKTLISFVLYGDPLAQPYGYGYGAKYIVRSLKPLSTVKTVCDRSTQDDSTGPVPAEVATYIKHVVAQYLPGMEDAHLTFSQEHTECHDAGHVCPTGQFKGKSSPAQTTGRQLVTLSKQVQRSEHVHHHYARLTLDAQGKLVKLVVSR